MYLRNGEWLDARVAGLRDHASWMSPEGYGLVISSIVPHSVGLFDPEGHHVVEIPAETFVRITTCLGAVIPHAR